MNRRQFTASLAALPVTKFLPTGLSAAVAPQSAPVPAGTYAWAQLIARAQNRCSPAMLARQLRLDPAAATQLFNEMLRDGVLQAPGAAGVAQAVQPINATGMQPPRLRQSFTKLRDAIFSEERAPLVKDPSTCQTCSDHAEDEDSEDAPAAQPAQESPERR